MNIIKKIINFFKSIFSNRKKTFVLENHQHAIEFLVGRIEFEIQHYEKNVTYEELLNALNIVKKQFPTLTKETNYEIILDKIISKLDSFFDDSANSYVDIDICDLKEIAINARNENEKNGQNNDEK